MFQRFATLIFALAAASIPTLASAQGFAPAKGSTWVKLGYIYSEADQNFAGIDEVRANRQRLKTHPEEEPGAVAHGERVDFRSRNGEIVGGDLYAHEVTLDANYSPIERLVVGGFVPVFKISHYENPRPYTTEERGVGDVQLYAGYQLTSRDQSKVGTSLFIKGKIPTSYEFPYTNQALLGEGQFDLSAALATSIALGPRIYLNNTLEFKHRFGWVKNASEPDLYALPGDELHLGLGLGGGPTDWLWLSAGWGGMWGQAWLVQRVGEPSPTITQQRQFQFATASAYIMFGKWFGVDGLALDLFAKAPLAGRDHATLSSYGGGVAYGF